MSACHQLRLGKTTLCSELSNKGERCKKLVRLQPFRLGYETVCLLFTSLYLRKYADMNVLCRDRRALFFFFFLSTKESCYKRLNAFKKRSQQKKNAVLSAMKRPQTERPHVLRAMGQ